MAYGEQSLKEKKIKSQDNSWKKSKYSFTHNF